MGEVQTLDKSHHSLSGLSLSVFLRGGSPVECVQLFLGVAERAEWAFVFDAYVALFFNEDSVEERLVAQSPVRVVCSLVDARRCWRAGRGESSTFARTAAYSS